jgi:electron transfer flavoprotein beta subunit
MPLNIVVCVKQVPDPVHLSKIRLDPRTRTLQREGVPVVLNPVDRNAIEEALKLKSILGGEITAVTMGPPKALEAIQDAYAMGADDGIHLCDRAFAGADTLATVYALVPAIEKVADLGLILFGNESIDSGTGQVPVQVAELLDLPHATQVDKLELAEGGSKITAWQVTVTGHLEIQLTLPAVVSVTKDINTPRKPTIMGIMEATKKEITTYTAGDLGIDVNTVGKDGSPTQVHEIAAYDIKRKGQRLEGSPEDVAKQAMEIIHKSGVI